MKKKFSDTKIITSHFDPEAGVGNAYKFWADWPQVFKAVLFGWENTLDHPAQFHYAIDYADHLSTAINRTTHTAFAELGITKGTVMDAGCGVGGVSLTLAKVYPNIKFIGVTLSNGQIATAQNRAKNAHIKNAEYILANYLNLSFPNNSFDGILGIETFCYVVDRDKPLLLKELYRVLKPGGRLVIFDGFLSDRPQKEMRMKKMHVRINAGWSLPDRISTAKYFVSCAKKQGFTVVKNEDFTHRILAASSEIVKRVKLLRLLTPLALFFIQLRKWGIKLPFISKSGLDMPDIFLFADTAELQYDMFRCGDVEYREVVLEKK